MSEHAAPSQYDRLLGHLDGLPDALSTRPTTIRDTTPITGQSQTFIIHTVRQAGEGDFIFLEFFGDAGHVRLALPPKVANAIARQRAALTKRGRSMRAKAQAADRMARGEKPGFMRVVRGERAS